MRTIRRTAAFKRDYRRERKGRFARTVDRELAGVVAELAEGRALAPRHRDHALGGQWKDHRDCHVRPDLVLIYRKPDAEHLDLVRLGSHSELGL
ncbi:MAG: type II toxin-antitoxin system YafQ family toxin [Rhodospirillaceae bacterium]|nr:type II toxin-antitoxin system YafQ family toxin [Rhodospirillaceae bacterium]MYK59112.1 type II toxin-antitoxin system YafQ family toxin [Rhodospirillaceae bacterium]